MPIKIDRADKLFSLWVRTRDGWQCKRCGREYTPPTTALQCSHFIGRRSENTRFEPLNADSLCHGCHRFFTANPLEHVEWQIKLKGAAMVDKLRLASNTYKKKDRKLEALYWARRLAEDFGVKP